MFVGLKVLIIKLNNEKMDVYYIRIIDSIGRTMYMLPKPQMNSGIDISHFRKGIYTLILTDSSTRKTSSEKFIVE